MDKAEQGASTHRRRMIFIPGFDPRSPAAYHRIWKREAPRQAEVSEADISIGKLARIDPLSSEFCVESRFDGRAAHTRITVLRWDDLVRQWWLKGDFRSMAAVPVWMWRMARHGVYGLAARSARPLFMSLVTPPALVGLSLLLTLLLAFAAVILHPLALVLVLPLGGGLALSLWRFAEKTYGCSWLNQSLHFIALSGTRCLPEQDARCAEFARRLVEAAEDPGIDELVLVGFSLGATQSVRAMAQAIRLKPDLGQGRVKVGLLTVGQTYGAYSLLKDEGFARDRELVAHSHDIFWADATSASDPASACRVSPAHGIEGLPAQRPLSLTPRFHKVLSPERFAHIRRRPLEFHFQYLNAVDFPGGYNWFAITAGPDLLSAQKAT